jgi:hypothetical protein
LGGKPAAVAWPLSTAKEKTLSLFSQKQGLFFFLSDLTLPKNFLAVVPELIDGFLDVAQGKMGFLLFVNRKRRIPSLCQLLDGTHINVAVVEKSFQPRHVFDEKSAVLPDGIAAKRRLAFLAVLGKEPQHRLFRLPAIY